MDALALPMNKWNINPKEIQFDDYTDWQKPYAKLKQFQIQCPFRTLVIDSITSGADAINASTAKLKGEPMKIAGITVNSIEDYKAEESALRELVSLLKDIHKFHKVNIVLIAHVIQKEMKSEDGKTHMARSIVTAGKAIAQKIPAYCAEVYHFNIVKGVNVSRGGQYGLLTTHTGDDFARTSLPISPEIVFGDEPLYEKWIAPAIQKMKPTISTQTTTPITIAKG
jgi:hypothetical protein